MSWYPLATRRPIPLGFLGTLALVAAVEWAIGRHDALFSIVEADAWKSARAAAEHAPAGGVLTMGDSQVELGVSPLTLEAHLGRPVRCLALPGGQPSSTYLLLRRAIRAGAAPAAVVVDFEPQLLRDGRAVNQRLWPELANLAECLDLARTLGDADAFASMALGRLFPSCRERAEIRGACMAGLRGEASPMPERLAMARRNRGVNRGALILGKQPPGYQHNYDAWCNPTPTAWRPSPANEAYTHRFLDLAAEHEIPVFCALMPIVEGLRRKSEASGIEPAYLAWVRRIQARHPNLVVLDWRDAGYPDSLFIDGQHLDVEGSASVAIAAADHLGRAFRGEAGPGRWVKMPPFRVDGSQLALEDHMRSIEVVQSSGVVRR